MTDQAGVGAVSLLRHPGFAQAGEIGVLAQGADLWYLVTWDGPQPSEARITIIGAQPSGFGEFGGGAFALAFEAIRGSEEGVDVWLSRLANMFVISGNTAFTYQNKRVDTKQIGRELGVRYDG